MNFFERTTVKVKCSSTFSLYFKLKLWNIKVRFSADSLIIFHKKTWFSCKKLFPMNFQYYVMPRSSDFEVSHKGSNIKGLNLLTIFEIRLKKLGTLVFRSFYFLVLLFCACNFFSPVIAKYRVPGHFFGLAQNNNILAMHPVCFLRST